MSITVVVAQVPAKPQPPRLLNDFSGLFTEAQASSLERELVAFDDSTSNQICVVTLSDIQDADINMLAYEILSSWSVGQSGKNNGVVLLIQHAVGQSGGRLAISVGYGLEGVLTDALSKRIIEREILPFFKQDAYFEGVQAGIRAIKQAAVGEYAATAQEGDDQENVKALLGFVAFFAILIVFLLVVVAANHRNNPTNMGSSNRKGLSAWEILLLLNALGGRGRGGFGGGGFGGGGFGGGGFGGGGFGGFGGGMGGGGGASGSW